MSIHISPHYCYEGFVHPLCLEDAITVFEDRISGWQLGIALELANREVPDRGFAQLHILMSYFEMIAQFHEGLPSRHESYDAFRRGARLVFPRLAEWQQENVETFLRTLYERVRCGLYHTALTRTGIILSTNPIAPLLYGEYADGSLCIHLDPDRLAADLAGHFRHYVQQLRDPRNGELRSRFYARFREDGL